MTSHESEQIKEIIDEVHSEKKEGKELINTKDSVRNSDDVDMEGVNRKRLQSPKRKDGTKYIPSNPIRGREKWVTTHSTDRARSPKRSPGKSHVREMNQSPRRGKTDHSGRPIPPPTGNEILESSLGDTSPIRPIKAIKDSVTRNPAHASSPDVEHCNSAPSESKEAKPKISPSSANNGEKGRRSKSPKKERVHCPRRYEKGHNKTSPSAEIKSLKKIRSSSPRRLREPSMVLPPSSEQESEADEETVDEQHSTALQLDLQGQIATLHLSPTGPGRFAPKVDNKLPISNLLDETHDLFGDTVGNQKLNKPSQQIKMPNDRETKQSDPPTPPPSLKAIDETDLQPWGSPTATMDHETGHNSHNVNSSNKSPRSPLAVRKAMKALKYTKPSIASMQNAVGKLSTGFQQTLGWNGRHHQIQDDDDLSELMGWQ